MVPPQPPGDDSRERYRLFFLIRSLGRGGSERQLVELVKALDRGRFSVTVATFYDGGAFRDELERLDGVRVVSLHKRGRWDLLPFMKRLWHEVRAARPQIIHGYLGTANELALVASRFARSKSVWGMRNSNMDFSNYDALQGLGYWVDSVLSHFVDLIIVNSGAGAAFHGGRGYRRDSMTVIPNGIDVSYFRPDPEGRQRVRSEWNVGDAPLVGLVGRLDPMKDHRTFLAAAAEVARARANARFVCVGDGPERLRLELRRLARELGLGHRLTWAGARGDMAAVHSALDVAVSSSLGEGFPNVVAEAMACCAPCIATDVGDSRTIIGDERWVVQPSSPGGLAAAISTLLALAPDIRRQIGEECRLRIVERYSVDRLARDTEAALLELLKAA